MRRRFTDEDLLSCLERELKKREQVYPRLIEAKKMSEKTAQIQIAMMQELVYVFKEKVEKHPSQSQLFAVEIQ